MSHSPFKSAATIPRRHLLKLAALSLLPGSVRSQSQDHPLATPPTRVITKGPGHHWFGYYDKLQFDVSNRFVLGMKVDFEHRSPEPDDVIQIGMVDLEEKDAWIPLGESRAWNWQQGCMLQWLPGSASKIIWNDRIKDQFVCHILDISTGEKNTVDHPVYSVNPNGREAVSCDFTRVAAVRPGYGYAGGHDPYADDPAPEKTGITRVNLQNGKVDLIITHAQLAALGTLPQADTDASHHAYHLLYSPNGKRFILLHRWRYPDDKRLTRLITATPDGADLRIVIPNGYASHFIWRDNDHILSQSKGWLGNEKWGNFLFADREQGIIEEVGRDVMDSGGHFLYLRNKEWLLNDTYPKGIRRIQAPHLYHIASNRRIDIGHFHSPPEYTGEWRVDNHPRLSRDERFVCLDAPHQDQGRQLHLIDIQDIS